MYYQCRSYLNLFYLTRSRPFGTHHDFAALHEGMMDSLMTEPRAHIMLQHPSAGEQVPEETEAIRRVGHEFLKNCIIANKDIDGKKPNANLYTKWRGIDVNANRIMGT